MYTIFEKRERKMFVICPKCSAKYRIPSEITLQEGQKMQCSACKHIFVYEQIKNESFETEVEIPKDPVLPSGNVVIKEENILIKKSLPEVFKPVQPMSVSQGSKVFVCVFIFILVLFLCMAMWFVRDILKTDYTSFNSDNHIPRVGTVPNLPDSKEIEIPLFENGISESKTSSIEGLDNFLHFHSVRFHKQAESLLIEGIIQNDANFSQKLPERIYATGYNQHGKELFQKEIFLSNDIIEPYGQKAFFGTYSPAPNGVQWIEVSCKK